MSNGNDFSWMFYGCSSLSSIKGLQNWNVSKCNNFSYMFTLCSSLLDIKELLIWNLPEREYEDMILLKSSNNYFFH